MDLNQLSPTSTKDETAATAVKNVVSDIGNKRSRKGDISQARDDWRSTINILDDYAAYCEALIHVMEPLKSICDGLLDYVTSATHRVELDLPGRRPLNFVPCRAGPRARDFEKNEIENMLSMNVIEPDKTKWDLPVVFALKRDGNLQIFVYHCRLSSITVRDSYSLPWMDE